MASTRDQMFEQLLCSICLDVFTEPVTIPCGHNFCKSCVSVYWATNASSTCPLCGRTFCRAPRRLRLCVNTTFRNLVDQFKGARDRDADERPPASGAPCDLCAGTRKPATKSCSVCLTSYCEEHVRSHSARFTKHQLTEPVVNLEDRMCRRHGRPLKLFCKTRQAIMCVLCVEPPGTQTALPLQEVYMEKKVELGRAEAKVRKRIERTLTAVEENQRMCDHRLVNTHREIARVERLFVGRRSCQNLWERFATDSKKALRDIERAAARRKEQLEEELAGLRSRAAELQQLSQCSDPVHVLQTFPTLNDLPVTSVRCTSVCSHLWGKSFKDIEEHVRSHGARFTKHQLAEPVANLEDRMCRRHGRPLKLFCKTRQAIMCVLCVEPPGTQTALPLQEVYMEKKVELGRAEAKVRKRIERTLTAVEENQRMCDHRLVNTHREIARVERLFVGRRSCQNLWERFATDSKKALRDIERAAARRKEQLEEELAGLRSRAAELQQLSQCSDPVHVLQTFPTLNDLPVTSVRCTSVCSHLWGKSFKDIEDELGQLS